MIDQDVLQMGTRMELLHWFQPNLVATSDNANLSFDPTVAVLQLLLVQPT